MMIMTTYVAWAERVPGVQERSQNYPINARLTQPLWTHTMHCRVYYYYQHRKVLFTSPHPEVQPNPILSNPTYGCHGVFHISNLEALIQAQNL